VINTQKEKEQNKKTKQLFFFFISTALGKNENNAGYMANLSILEITEIREEGK